MAWTITRSLTVSGFTADADLATGGPSAASSAGISPVLFPSQVPGSTATARALRIAALARDSTGAAVQKPAGTVTVRVLEQIAERLVEVTTVAVGFDDPAKVEVEPGTLFFEVEALDALDAGVATIRLFWAVA